PSEAWLRRPAWIDGGIYPPRFYTSEAMMDEELRRAGISPKSRQARLAPPPMSQSSSSEMDSSPLSPRNQNIASNVLAAPVNLMGPHYQCSHLITVTFAFTAAPTGVRGRAALPKKCKAVKMDKMNLSQISRVDFISNCLRVHNKADKFAPGVHSGPNFKIWWTGKTGGKGGAPTVQNDQQFEIALNALQKRDLEKTQVSVEFDIDEMEGFRIKDTAAWEATSVSVGNADEELAYGTRVPSVEGFSDTAQLHGGIIVELKKKWPCQKHPGEHGESGYCYIPPSGDHIRLNPLRLKLWAAAIASQDATKHEPPNITAFDGNLSRSKRGLGPKPRGRKGHQDSSSPLRSDMLAMLVTSLLPLAGDNSRKRRMSSSEPPSTPKRPKPSTPPAPLSPPSPVSSLPEQGSELQACLAEFQAIHGHDLSSSAGPLLAEDYTPDVIPFVADTKLQTVTAASRGVIIKLKIFCKDWHARYERKV
ncbi:hypothetical protein CPC08DRAFT_606382, partial [Agrocybe pediades]